MFTLSANVCEIFTVELYMTLTLTFGTGKVKCKYANGMAVCDLSITMFAPFVTICEKFAIEMCMTLTLIFRIGQCQI